MDISVVIATYNQKERLKLVIHALAQQTLPVDHFEVIVVDDGSNDGTSQMLKGFARENVKVVSLKTNKGRCTARNLGITEAIGTLVVFLDGDALPCPELLDAYRQGLTAFGPRALMCGFQYCLPDLEYIQDPETGALADTLVDSDVVKRHMRSRRWEYIITKDIIERDFAEIHSRAVKGGYPFPSICKMQDQLQAQLQKKPNARLNWLSFFPHNSAVPIGLLREFGGYDTEIIFCEGWELAYRLQTGGAEVRPVPQALSYHLYHYHHFTESGELEIEMEKRNRALEYMAAKHSDPYVQLIRFWSLYSPRNRFIPREVIMEDLGEIERLYCAMDVETWTQYQMLLNRCPQGGYYGR